METTHGNLTVIIANSHIDITNKSILARLVFRDGGYAQEFYALDKDGEFQLVLSSLHKNLIPASEHRVCASPMISGSQPHLFAVTRDSLRTLYSEARIVTHTEKSVVILLLGSSMGHNLKQKIELRDGEKCVHVMIEDNIEPGTKPPLVEYLMSSYAFLPARWAVTHGSNIDYTWAPVLRPGDDQVIGDRAFYSPAVIVQHGHMAAALIPDLYTPNEDKQMQTALDLDTSNGLLSSPLISYGYCGYEECGGMYAHDMTMAKRLKTPVLEFGYELLLDADCKHKSIHKQVSKRLWELYGVKSKAHSGKSNICNAAEKDTCNGNQLRHALLEPDAWAAYGVYFAGDAALKSGARALINALLSAPKYAGLFATKFDSVKQMWSGCNDDVDKAYYNSVECSRQCNWLLRWYLEIDQNSQIVDFCKDYADFLVNVIHNGGSIPSFFDKYGTSLPTLLKSSQTAISALFLAKMGSITGDSQYTLAAQNSMRFVTKHNLYQDHTLIDRGNCLTRSIRDPHTSALPQSGWSMLWSAMAHIELFESTKESKFVGQGKDVFDQLCLLQSVYGENTSIPFGLCARSNIDTAADVELTAGFAECAMRYARATGERHYFERGAAALNAAMHKGDVSALTLARIAAIDAVIRSSFGVAFVHVGKKWAYPVNGATIKSAAFDQGKLSITINAAQTGAQKIVFDGMRGKSYRLCINRCERIFSADEMRSGIPIPRH